MHVGKSVTHGSRPSIHHLGTQDSPDLYASQPTTIAMAEPRARPRRPNHNPTSTTNGAQPSTTFPSSDLSDLLYAFASSPPHLPSTLSVLDEILTDFIIETCHLAALSASYSRRSKLKIEDFKFVLRHDERLLGRSMEHIWRDKRIKENRRVAGMMDEGGAAAGLEAAAREGGVEGIEMRVQGKRGRRKKRKREGEDLQEDGEGEGERSGKRVAS